MMIESVRPNFFSKLNLATLYLGAVCLILSTIVNPAGVNARQVGDEPTCEVHEVPLKPGIVRVYYGILWPTPEYIEFKVAERKEFPHAMTSIEGGCVEDENRPVAEVYYCEKCRKARRQWLKAHSPAKVEEREKTFIALERPAGRRL